MEIRDYINVIFKRKYIIAACAILVLGVAAYVNYLVITPKYSAQARVLVDQPPRVLMIGERSSYAPPPLSVETQMKLVKSMDVAERAARILYPRMPRKDVGPFGLGLKNRIQVTNEPETGIINISVESVNPKECAVVSNAFADAFEEMSTYFAKSSARDATRFIEQQLRIAEFNLNRKEKAVFDFNQSNGIISLDDDLVHINTSISEFEHNMLTEEVKSQELEAKSKSLERVLQDMDMRIYRNPMSMLDSQTIVNLRQAIETLEVERAVLLQKFKPDHPRVREVETRIKNTTDRLEQQVSEIVGNRVVVQNQYLDEKQQIIELTTELFLSNIRVKLYGNILARLRTQQMKFPRIQYEYARLLREKEVAEKLYLLLYEKRQQAKIDEVQQDVKVRVFERASPPDQPFWPNRKKNIGVALIFGLFVGIGLAFLLEEMEETVRTSDDVKNYLNLPVLGSIPYSAETINKLITDVPLKSPIAEAYRRLSFFTQLFCLDPPIKTLLVTSSKSDEGKTTTLANLAISMAQEGTKVLAIDTDLRRPMLHRLFGIDNSLGLSNILSGELEAEIAVSDLSVSGHLPRESFMEVVVDRIIQPLPIKGLSVIPSGPLPANSIELLRSERMLTFMRIAEKKADLVIFDSPPAIHVIDAVVLAQILDGVLLVINSGRINKDEAMQVKYMIESTKTPIIGVALNNIEASSPDYYYYYYYGGYGYGTRQRRKRVKLKR